MSAIFGKPETAKPVEDPDLKKREAERLAQLDQEKADQKRRDEEDRRARLRGLRGSRSLLTAGAAGYVADKKEHLG